MAYVPDKAVLNFYKLTPSEIKLFCFYCKARNSKTGGWQLPDLVVAAKMNMSRSIVTEARNRLESKGWIRVLEGNFIVPIMGFEFVENSTSEISQNSDVENSTNMSKTRQMDVENSTNMSKTRQMDVENSTCLSKTRHGNVENSTNIVENSTSPFKRNITSPITSPRDQEKRKREKILFSQREREVCDAIEANPVPKTAHTPKKDSFFDNFFLKEFWAVFPGQNLSEPQMHTIANRIRDGTVWRAALEYWSSNNFNPQRVGKLCDKHDEILEGSSNGKNNRPQTEYGRRIRDTEDLIEDLRRQADEARLLA